MNFFLQSMQINIYCYLSINLYYTLRQEYGNFSLNFWECLRSEMEEGKPNYVISIDEGLEFKVLEEELSSEEENNEDANVLGLCRLLRSHGSLPTTPTLWYCNKTATKDN